MATATGAAESHSYWPPAWTYDFGRATDHRRDLGSRRSHGHGLGPQPLRNDRHELRRPGAAHHDAGNGTRRCQVRRAPGAEDHAHGGQRHRPHHGTAVDGQRHVYGPVLPALGVFARAVQGVDDPHSSRLRTEHIGLVGLLRTDPVLGEPFIQPGHQETVRSTVALLAQLLAGQGARPQVDQKVAGLVGQFDGHPSLGVQLHGLVHHSSPHVGSGPPDPLPDGPPGRSHPGGPPVCPTTGPVRPDDYAPPS